MGQAPVGVIGGTGVYDPAWLDGAEPRTVDTPYGSVAVVTGSVDGAPAVFLNRHGAGHALPPHRVNYRANVYALWRLGVRRVVATAAVGSLHRALAPGHLLLADQFLDFTKGRVATFFDGGPGGVVHTDMTEPYCRGLREALRAEAVAQRLPLTAGGTYVATEGPRFESAAEIRAFRLLGGDVVGMTGVPEVVLARELGLCYATVALVTNYAAGLAGARLTHQEVLDVMARQSASVRHLLRAVLPRLDAVACDCAGAPAALPPAAREEGTGP
ncbi:MAG: S-methyl-5'-thioadenosine phosphorylase [Actinomycetia bacterium]|nr:S-methyl-5'-thioadenosine phosphorylase [Actinomycetes bacterium]